MPRLLVIPAKAAIQKPRILTGPMDSRLGNRSCVALQSLVSDAADSPNVLFVVPPASMQSFAGMTSKWGSPQQRGWGQVSLLALRSEEHTAELQSRGQLVCRLQLENKKPYIV